MENGNGQSTAQVEAKTELPEAIKLGEQLRSIRESKGLSLMQITEQLDIRSYLLNDMEKGRFAHLRLGDCLAYAKLLGVNADLVKGVHALVLQHKANNDSAASKLKLYVGAGVMVASVLILCLLLAKGNDAAPSGDGLIEVENTPSATLEPLTTAPSPAPVVESNLVLEEQSDASVNDTQAPANQLENLNEAYNQEATLPASNEAPNSVNPNSATLDATNSVNGNEAIELEDNASAKPELQEAPNEVQNNGVANGTRALDANFGATATKNPNINQNPNEVLSTTPANESGVVIVAPATQDVAMKNEDASPKVTQTTQAPKVTTQNKTTLKSEAKTEAPKTTTKKAVSKKATNTKKSTQTATQVKTQTSNSKPLALGEVRSLADELGIKPKTTNAPNKTTASKSAVSVANAKPKATSSITATVAPKAASTNTKVEPTSTTSKGGPKVVSPAMNTNTTLKAGEIRPLSKE